MKLSLNLFSKYTVASHPIFLSSIDPVFALSSVSAAALECLYFHKRGFPLW